MENGLPFTVLIDLEAKEGCRRDLVLSLHRLQNLAMTSSGNQGGVSWQVVDTPNRFLMVSHWDHVNSWLRCLRSPQTRAAFHEMSAILAEAPISTYLQNIEEVA